MAGVLEAMDSSRLMFFLGAGVSFPLPAGAPLFGDVRDACAEAIGIPVRRWRTDGPRRQLLAHTIPEVFLSGFARSGIRLSETLAATVTGPPTARPNGVHRAVATQIRGGASVWTTNWDQFIERAYEEAFQVALTAAAPPGPPSAAPKGLLYKLHGDAAHPETLRFRHSQVVAPLEDEWADALVDDARGKTIIIAGYGGADIDLFEPLSSAIDVASAVVWLEGLAGSEVTEGVRYEAWRYRLPITRGPISKGLLTAKSILWCGNGGLESSPSRALLDLFGSTDDVSAIPPKESTYRWVQAQLKAARGLGRRSGRMALTKAVMEDRIGRRAWAGVALARAAITGDRRVRVKARKNIGRVAAGLEQRIAGRLDRIAPGSRGPSSNTAFWTDEEVHDAARCLADPARSADEILDAVTTVRWMGDLYSALQAARRALALSLALDLDDPDHDWTERIARASFECGNILLWQGRHEVADEICRSGYMRMTGPKWLAWELSTRASSASLRGEHADAQLLIDEALNINLIDKREDSTAALLVASAQCARLAGDLDAATVAIRRIGATSRRSRQMQSLIDLEMSELDLARGAIDEAVVRLTDLLQCQVPLIAAVAALRLVEAGAPAGMLDSAEHGFLRTGCTWGIARVAAHRGAPWNAAEARQLGVVQELIIPGGPSVV